MQPKTEEFLYLLLWSAEQLTRPSFRNLDDSFESWAYRNGLLRQIARLEQQQLVERKSGTADRVFRLTAGGRLHALGGRDPQAQWSRDWDGHWRIVLYDFRAGENKERTRLRRYLCAQGFGYLQNSVWISPHPLQEQPRILHGGKIDVETLILLEARPCAGESDGEIVAGAWDFERINRGYKRHMSVLAQKPPGPARSKAQAQALRRWAALERAAWWEAVRLDPLLPERILPADYLGQQAWQSRIKVFGAARRDLESFPG